MLTAFGTVFALCRPKKTKLFTRVEKFVFFGKNVYLATVDSPSRGPGDGNGIRSDRNGWGRATRLTD